jgi:hypothetical protein
VSRAGPPERFLEGMRPNSRAGVKLRSVRVVRGGAAAGRAL